MAALPPFSSLRALETAARLQSYSRAAEALNVTHGAISQQIRGLEERYGVRLFRRDGNAMLPSETALKLARRVAEATRALEAGVAELQAERGTKTLTVTTVTGFANRWLAPHMRDFAKHFPDVLVNIVSDDRLADFGRGEVDVGLRYGPGGWPDLEAEPLFKETLYPVCSPDFLAAHPLTRPEDLLDVSLLRHRYWPWRLWFAAVGIAYDEPATGLLFDDSGLLAEAATQGLGVALARSSLVAHDVASGRLVRPLPAEIAAEFGHYVVWRADSRKLPLINRFRDWLRGQIATTGAAAAAVP